MADKHTLAFEIGVEEIPAFDLDSANKQLEKMVPAAFADARIPYDSIEIHSSPRRLIVMAYGVERDGVRGWLNIARWDDALARTDGKTVTFTTPLLEIAFTGVGIACR